VTFEQLQVYKKIKENPSLVRDSRSRAIINTNPDEYIAAKRRRAKAQRENQRIQDLQNEVTELKEMLTQLINKQ
jgi:hypothetical protein